MSMVFSGNYLYLEAKNVTGSSVKEFVNVQNSVFERGVHLLFFEPITTCKYEGVHYLAVPVFGGLLGLLPVISILPKLLAYAALLASFKWQHRHKGFLWWCGASKPAYLAVKKRVFR